MNRPAKTITGTNVGIVHTASTHGPTQSRCPKCHGMCGPAVTNGGQSVMRCGSCRFTYSLRPM